MNIEKFGTTLLFVIFLFMIFQGLRMAVKISIPSITKISPSLGTALASVA